MPAGDVETYHADGSWKNRIEGHGDLPATYDTREDAVAAGREEAKDRRAEHIIRKLDGTIGDRHTYGHDPRDIPG